MPYRMDARGAGRDALDQLVELGALDVEYADDGTWAALLPDGVAPARVARALGVGSVTVSPALGRDAGSVWILRPRPIRIGSLLIVPAEGDGRPEPGRIALVDASAFGTGLHPTTALCIEAIEEAVRIACPDSLLDVGTGSGVLALAALRLGVPRALGLDVDEAALHVATENARLNALADRLHLARGGPGTLAGTWPLVVANVLAAPLIEMAPALVRRLGHRGRLVLSGMPSPVEPEVTRAYHRLGMRRLHVTSRAGWVAVVLEASW